MTACDLGQLGDLRSSEKPKRRWRIEVGRRQDLTAEPRFCPMYKNPGICVLASRHLCRWVSWQRSCIATCGFWRWDLGEISVRTRWCTACIWMLFLDPWQGAGPLEASCEGIVWKCPGSRSWMAPSLFQILSYAQSSDKTVTVPHLTFKPCTFESLPKFQVLLLFSGRWAKLLSSAWDLTQSQREKGDAPHLEDTLQFDTTRSLENHARDAIGSFIWVNFKLFNHNVTAMASRGNHGKMTLCRATELF